MPVPRRRGPRTRSWAYGQDRRRTQPTEAIAVASEVGGKPRVCGDLTTTWKELIKEKRGLSYSKYK